MTIDQFRKTAFGNGDLAEYRDSKLYRIVSVNFDEALICLASDVEDQDCWFWVRCESVKNIGRIVGEPRTPEVSCLTFV